jgi:hypothetical protein
MVWQKSAVQLGKELGVSDVAIAKTCKKHHIPTPPIGYWSRVEHGQKVPKAKLPSIDDARLQTITIEGISADRRRGRLSDETQQKVLLEESDASKIIVSGNLIAPHPLVEKTLKSLQSNSPDDEGLVHPKAKGCLDVAVGKDSIDRAIRIMDALIKAMIARGMQVWTKGDEYVWTSFVELENEKFAIRLRESIGERPKQLTSAQIKENAKYQFFEVHKTTEKYPRGLLTLSIGAERSYDRKRWSELDGKPLEGRLNKPMTWLYAECERIRVRRAQWAEEKRRDQERQRRWEEAKAKREEEERLRRVDEQRRAKLVQDAQAWETANLVRRYVDAVEQGIVAKHQTIVAESDIAGWLRWAREHADRLDPLCERKSGS